MHALTAAHPFLALGTIVRVENLATGRSVEVQINDRGPFVAGRIIDLSMAAAERIGLKAEGIGFVALSVEPRRQPQPGRPGSAARPVVATASAMRF
jgi:rare lipoprotein A